MSLKEDLRELGVKPVKGQNFLEDKKVITALVEAGEVEGKKVLEIGAGTGQLTREIVERAESLTALETDTRMANYLGERFPGVSVLEQDFLEYRIPGKIERCVSNLPFQISKPAVKKLGESQVQSALILQDALADKLVAEPGDGRYGYTSVMANYYFIPVKLQEIDRNSFYPEPEVEAAIVKLYPNRERHGVEDEDLFFRLAKALFTHKRKKTRNAFVDARNILEIEKDEAKKVRDQLPHSDVRVNQLEIIQLKEITEFLVSEDILQS